jgi:hypothetical protein
MNASWLSTALRLIVLTSVIASAGCGGKPTPTPQQKEEQRQKLIKNAERERREG